MRVSVFISIVIFLAAILGCSNRNDEKKNIATVLDKTKQVSDSPTARKIFFTGIIGKKAGLYLFDPSTQDYSGFWKSDKEDVVDLLASSDKNNLFMLTAGNSGKKGIFPFVNGIKLYLINSDSNSVKYVDNIGSGLQVFSKWESENSFKVMLNKMDAASGTTVSQITRIYNTSGIKLSDKQKSYNLLEAGFPQFPGDGAMLISPNKNYSVKSIAQNLYEIYLIDHRKKDEERIITKENQKLSAVDWTEDGKYLVFSTVDITPMNKTLYNEEPQTSKLFIYSLVEKKIAAKFEGSGVKNFLLNGNHLFFDDGFHEKSKILIYNISTGHISDTLKISGGCGLRFIPFIPNYEA